MSKEDVTRKAVVIATKAVSNASAQLAKILYTGPDQVMLSPTEIRKSIEGGNTDLLPYAASADDVDNNLLDNMLSNGQVRRKM